MGNFFAKAFATLVVGLLGLAVVLVWIGLLAGSYILLKMITGAI